MNRRSFLAGVVATLVAPVRVPAGRVTMPVVVIPWPDPPAFRTVNEWGPAWTYDGLMDMFADGSLERAAERGRNSDESWAFSDLKIGNL